MFLCVAIETTAHQLHPIKKTFWHFFNLWQRMMLYLRSTLSMARKMLDVHPKLYKMISYLLLLTIFVDRLLNHYSFLKIHFQ